MTVPRARRWASIVAIVASVYALLAAVWVPPEFFTGGDAGEVGHSTWLIIAYALAAALGLGGVLTAQRNAGLARLMVAAAGIILLSGFLAMRQVTALALVSIGLTGLMLIGSAVFLGAMPSPEEEGKAR